MPRRDLERRVKRCLVNEVHMAQAFHLYALDVIAVNAIKECRLRQLMLLTSLPIVLPDKFMQIFTDKMLNRLVLQLRVSNIIVVVADEPRIHRETSLDLRLVRSDK